MSFSVSKQGRFPPCFETDSVKPFQSISLERMDLSRSIANAPENTLSPGALAITVDGRHVMVFLEKDTWISADPSQGKVVIEKPSISRNLWFDANVKFYSWSVLILYNDF